MKNLYKTYKNLLSCLSYYGAELRISWADDDRINIRTVINNSQKKVHYRSVVRSVGGPMGPQIYDL